MEWFLVVNIGPKPEPKAIIAESFSDSNNLNSYN
jgi:hypothetical protein